MIAVSFFSLLFIIASAVSGSIPGLVQQADAEVAPLTHEIPPSNSNATFGFE